MARPKKDNADYFSHDADMRNDPKIKAIRRRYGLKGYAIYNMMLELLTDSDFFQYEWTELNIEITAGDFDVSTEDLELIIGYCTNTLQLFTIENNLIWCNTLRKRFDSLLSKRKRDRNRVIDSENPHSKVKYSKVKKSKVDKSIPSIEDIKKYTIEKGYEVDANKIFHYYNDNNWIDAKGNEVKNWKTKILNNWCKEENKIKPKVFSLSDYKIPNSDLYGYPERMLIEKCKSGDYPLEEKD